MARCAYCGMYYVMRGACLRKHEVLCPLRSSLHSKCEASKPSTIALRSSLRRAPREPRRCASSLHCKREASNPGTIALRSSLRRVRGRDTMPTELRRYRAALRESKLAKERARQKQRRARETPAARSERLCRRREARQRRLQRETPEERAERRRKAAAQEAERRRKKREHTRRPHVQRPPRHGEIRDWASREIRHARSARRDACGSAPPSRLGSQSARFTVTAETPSRPAGMPRLMPRRRSVATIRASEIVRCRLWRKFHFPLAGATAQ